MMGDSVVDPSHAVAVTGIGVVSSIGIGREAFWQSLCAGASGIAPIESFPVAPGAPRLAGEVRGDFNPRDFISSTHLRRMDRLSRMVVAASRLALDDGGLRIETLASDRLAVVIGSAFGNTAETDRHLERVYEKGPGFASPLIFPNLVLNAPASYAAMELGLTGVNFTVGQGEISAEQALATAYDLLRQGRADAVLAGGGDELSPLIYRAHREAGALSSQRGGREWSSPYDLQRNGVVLGEGAAVLLLEPRERARARAARVYAEIEDHVSFGVPSPLYDWPARALEAVAPLRKLLSEDSGSGAVDLVCGAANSSRRLDACEIDLLAQLFGEATGRVRLTSIRGATGELGAAGALTAAAACLALHEQVVPPLCNLETPEPAACRFAARRGEPQPLERVLLCTIARGGGGVGMTLRRLAH
jgi:3-oxoacyl-[acyl-carrier-protein] synthase II